MAGFQTVSNGEVVNQPDDDLLGTDPYVDDEDLDIKPEEMGAEPAPIVEPQEPKADSNEPEQKPGKEVAEPEEQEKPKPEEGGEGEGEGEGEGGEGEPAPKKEEPEADPAGVADPEPEPVKVPKARLDKVLRDKRALENRIQQLESQQQAPQSDPQQALDPQQAPEMVDPKAIAEALLDGDLDKYAELQAKRDDQIRQQVIQQAQAGISQEVSTQSKQASFDDVRLELESKYDFLDANSDQFDQGIVDTVTAFARSYVERGYTPADALTEASEKVIKIEKPELFQVAPAQTQGEKTDPKVEKLKQERLNIDKKLQAAAAQSPDITGGDVVGEPIPDFGAMSDDDFDKLSDAQLEEYTRQMQKLAAG